MTTSAPCLLIYDIPERSGIANPSVRLRRLAIRINLSCWVVRENDLPYALLDSMRTRGAIWHAIKFDSGEVEKLLELALEQIRKELKAAVSRALQQQRSAEGVLEDADMGEPERRAAYRARAVAIVRRTQRLVAAMKSGAERFGIVNFDGQFSGMSASVSGMDAAVKALCAALGITLGRARKSGVAAVRQGAASASADVMPADIFADLCEDHDIPVGELRAAYSQDLFGNL